MVSKLFVVRNLLSGLVDQSYVICNEAVAAVELCVPYSRRSPLDEWQLVLVGEINLETGMIVTTSHVIVPWDTRRLASASAAVME